MKKHRNNGLSSVYFLTLGCPKNANDSEMAAGILEAAGYSITENPYEADVLIVNTCGFINDAKTESIEKIFEMAEIKSETGADVCSDDFCESADCKCDADAKKAKLNSKVLVVSGCLAQRYGDELYKEMPEVDIFLGVNDYQRLPEILEHYTEGMREKYLSSYDREFVENMPRKLADNPYTATLKIAEGCDNICTYCVIPKIRGGYRSRKQEDIIKEAEMLASRGCKELILIAQDTTAYGKDIYGDYKLAELVKKLCSIDKIQWIRLMYCYEDRITDELIEVMATEEKVCHYIDIPIQHASDAVLKAMNRRSTRKSIETTLAKLRKAVPDIHIRTTLITGFPGETKEDFAQLEDFVENAAFERLGVFAYSKEEGTAAAEMKNQVRKDVKERRRDAIMRRQVEISLESNQKLVGQTLQVLIEGCDEEGAYYGRTRYDAPEIDNSVIIATNKALKAGDMINVLITDAFDYDLTGTQVD